MTTIQLQNIADSIAVQNWQGVCIRLGVSNAVIAQSAITYITGIPNGPSRAFYKSLESWMNEQGDKATLSKLTTALKECGFRGVASKL